MADLQPSKLPAGRRRQPFRPAVVVSRGAAGRGGASRKAAGRRAHGGHWSSAVHPGVRQGSPRDGVPAGLDDQADDRGGADAPGGRGQGDPGRSGVPPPARARGRAIGDHPAQSAQPHLGPARHAARQSGAAQAPRPAVGVPAIGADRAAAKPARQRRCTTRAWAFWWRQCWPRSWSGNRFPSRCAGRCSSRWACATPRWAWAAARIAATARCQVPDDPGGWNSPYWRNLGSPWGGAHGNAADVTRLLRAFASGQAGSLSKASTAAMLAHTTPASASGKKIATGSAGAWAWAAAAAPRRRSATPAPPASPPGWIPPRSQLRAAHHAAFGGVAGDVAGAGVGRGGGGAVNAGFHLSAPKWTRNRLTVFAVPGGGVARTHSLTRLVAATDVFA